MVSCCFWFHGRGFSDLRIGCSFSADGRNNKARAGQKRRASDVQHGRAGPAGVERCGLVVVHVNAHDAVLCHKVRCLSVLCGDRSCTGAVAVRVRRVDCDIERALQKVVAVLCLNLPDGIRLGVESADKELSLGIRMDGRDDISRLVGHFVMPPPSDLRRSGLPLAS